MNIEAACYSILSSAAGVAAIVGARVYLQQRLIGTALPAVTFEVRESRPMRVLAGESGLWSAQVVIVSTAEVYSDARTLAAAVRAAFQGAHAAAAGVVIVASRLDLEAPQEAGYDAGDETEPTRIEQEYVVHYRSA